MVDDPTLTAPAARRKHRVDLRADPCWIERIARQARRSGMNFTAYVKMSVNNQLARDEPLSRAEGTPDPLP